MGKPNLRMLCSKPATDYKQNIKMKESNCSRQIYKLQQEMTAVSHEEKIKLKKKKDLRRETIQDQQK